MPSIIIASDKSKSGKTMVRSVVSLYLRSRGFLVSTIPAIHGSSESNKESLELPGVEVLSGLETIDTNAVSDKEIGKISDIILKNSNEKMLISESSSTDMSHNKKLAESSNSKILLVADSIEKVQKAKEELGEHLAGIIYNNISRHRIDSARPGSEDGVLSVIPENRHMISSTVDQYVKHLKGKYIYESDKKNELVLNVLIGGIVLDWSVLYYESQKDVLALIRGDRPDLQLGALQAGGNVKGIVLTKGIEPIEYVTYEAKKLQIPLILVDYNTHEAADKISGIVDKSKFDHMEKLKSCLSHFTSNLSQHAVDKAMDLNTL